MFKHTVTLHLSALEVSSGLSRNRASVNMIYDAMITEVNSKLKRNSITSYPETVETLASPSEGVSRHAVRDRVT